MNIYLYMIFINLAKSIPTWAKKNYSLKLLNAFCDTPPNLAEFFYLQDTRIQQIKKELSIQNL